jgi:putative transcriptional regulator
MSKFNTMTVFRNNVEAHLIARGWTVQHLADAIGMDRSYLSKVIRGVHSPNLALLEKIAAACDVEVFELLQPRQMVS